MSSTFANRRKPRKIGGDDEEHDEGGGQEPVVKRPMHPKMKQKPKLRLSFGPGGTSMNDDAEQESEVILPKRSGLGRRAVEKSAVQRGLASSGLSDKVQFKVGLEQERPSYSEDYLKELRDSQPATPKNMTEKEKESTVDVAAKFGEVMKVTAPSAIPSEAEIREKKERRARLAKEHGYGAKEEDYIALDDAAQVDEWDPESLAEERDTRLLRDDEDFAEGFDEFVEDGRISLGRKAEREQKRKQREEMRELINEAEVPSDEDDSDLEEKAAYEAHQTRAAMGNGGRDRVDRPRTPPKMAALPRLSNSMDRFRANLAVMEKSRSQMINRMEDLRKEKADIAAREVEIQALIKEAGDNYEKLRLEAGLTPDETSEMQNSRGLETIGAPMAITAGNSESES
ncbi:uncharacterized protein ACHE_60617A [Aspergillus chevalieri]|uniref:Nineteen complex-related protein 2-domain-containing protein n=1 Tax=Aspergillus chevalieri TaxID=182096 RepID=A0A7R7VTW6_ASPCH|nr:uncharacterized protein ACHE_60617A [Aspergillus chevalieri]BCR90731.1 hypothetical protein ACHE_60617A [Aspergillus chevalieri]